MANRNQKSAPQWTQERIRSFRLVEASDNERAINAAIEAVAALLPSVEEDKPRNG